MIMCSINSRDEGQFQMIRITGNTVTNTTAECIDLIKKQLAVSEAVPAIKQIRMASQDYCRIKGDSL